MSKVQIDPHSYKARCGKNAGVTLGLLDKPIFARDSLEDVLAELNERSYENEVHQFVKTLTDGIGSFDKGGRECYYFKDEKDFACNYLLFDCIEMLIKAEITINVIKEQREKLLKDLITDTEKKKKI